MELIFLLKNYKVLKIQMNKNKYKDKKVLIFGLGLNQGGLGSAKFFASLGAKVRVTDLKSEEILKSSIDELKDFPEIEYTLGEHKNKDIDWADLIIKNPAVKPGNTYIEYALKKGKQVKMDMDIFLDFVKTSQIIGVTGTKGKSTTASLIYKLLKTSQGVRRVIFAGNIGKSVLDTIPYVKSNTLVILELSSFQLESFKTNKVSPKWAVITNITPDHLNYYSSMDEYIQSKKIIGKYQTEESFLFIRKDDPMVDNSEFLDGLKGRIIRFAKDDIPKDFHPLLMGEHNLENIAVSYQVGKTFGLNEKTILNILSKFKGIPFRMELIKTWNGVKIYNDTAATSPESGTRAIQTFPNCILICGGMNKKMDYTKYAKTLDKCVKRVFFLEGDATDAIISSLGALRSNLSIQGPYNNLEKLLADIKSEIKSGDIILFSPAATSFNLFQNEFDRGRKFNDAVKKIFGGEK